MDSFQASSFKYVKVPAKSVSLFGPLDPAEKPTRQHLNRGGKGHAYTRASQTSWSQTVCCDASRVGRRGISYFASEHAKYSASAQKNKTKPERSWCKSQHHINVRSSCTSQHHINVRSLRVARVKRIKYMVRKDKEFFKVCVVDRHSRTYRAIQFVDKHTICTGCPMEKHPIKSKTCG